MVVDGACEWCLLMSCTHFFQQLRILDLWPRGQACWPLVIFWLTEWKKYLELFGLTSQSSSGASSALYFTSFFFFFILYLKNVSLFVLLSLVFAWCQFGASSSAQRAVRAHVGVSVSVCMYVFVVGGYIRVQWVLRIKQKCEQCSCQPSASERAQITRDLVSPSSL